MESHESMRLLNRHLGINLRYCSAARYKRAEVDGAYTKDPKQTLATDWETPKST